MFTRYVLLLWSGIFINLAGDVGVIFLSSLPVCFSVFFYLFACFFIFSPLRLIIPLSRYLFLSLSCNPYVVFLRVPVCNYLFLCVSGCFYLLLCDYVCLYLILCVSVCLTSFSVSLLSCFFLCISFCLYLFLCVSVSFSHLYLCLYPSLPLSLFLCLSPYHFLHRSPYCSISPVHPLRPVELVKRQSVSRLHKLKKTAKASD